MDKEHPNEICKEFLSEGRIMNHEAITDNGEYYYCAHCGVELEMPTPAVEEL